MCAQFNKDQMPSAPPSYFESINKQEMNPPQYPNPNYPQYAPAQPGFNIPVQNEFNIPTQVVVVQAAPIPPLGPKSVRLTCPTCRAVVRTNIEENLAASAYLCCFLMSITMLWCCSCLPLCMEGFKTFKHSCSNCNAFIGVYKPS